MKKLFLLLCIIAANSNLKATYTASKHARSQCKDLKVLAIEAKLALEGYRSNSPTSPRGTDWNLLKRLIDNYKVNFNAYMSCLMIIDGVEEVISDGNISYHFIKGAHGPEFGAEIW